MTEAEKLLQETKSAVVAETQTEDICVIDSDLRIIDIPEQFKVLGVENDKDVKAMRFRIPKTYKGTDLSAFTISVNYQNARGTKGRYIVTDKKVSGDQIEFSWTVGKTATVYRGDTRFIVCMRLTGSDGVIKKEFNTTLATMTVLEGLEVDDPVIEQEEKDIIAQLLQIVDDKSKEAVQAVTAEGTKQIKAVQAAAQEIAADREQIKTNKADIADLMQTKAGAIINSARGERIAVGDSAGAFFEGLKLFGKSEQIQTKGYQLFDASKIPTKAAYGATITNNGDGSFTISGSGNLTENILIQYALTNEEAKKLFKAGRVTLKGDKTNPFIYLKFKNAAGTIKELQTIGEDSARYLDLTSEHINSEGFQASLGIYGNSGSAIVPGTVKPMVYQDGDGTWEPFSDGKASPSMEYKQDPESVGDGGNIELGVFGKNLCPISSMTDRKDNPSGSIYLTDMPLCEKYTLSCNVTKYQDDTRTNTRITIVLRYSDGTNKEFYSSKDTDNSERDGVKRFKTVTATLDKHKKLIGITIRTLDYSIYEGTLHAIAENIQMECGSEATDFVPYQDLRSTQFSTPNGLLGLPVDSGGNYTDSNGQQWICDEMDFKRGKYVQRIKKVVFNGSEGWRVQEDSAGQHQFFIDLKDALYPYNASDFDKTFLCNHFKSVNKAGTIDDSAVRNGVYKETFAPAFKPHGAINEISKFTSWLSENPTTILYILATPIETDIPEETMTAYRKLYTNYPSTVIQNDSGAGMEVEYVADTKQFILDQIKELVQTAYRNMANMLSLMPTNVQAEMIENDTNNILNNL